MKDAEQDGGYRRIDVPSIAYPFRDKWGKGIRVDKKYVRESYVMQRAFSPEDMVYIESIMRLMIVSCNQYGKLCIINGVFVPHSSA